VIGSEDELFTGANEADTMGNKTEQLQANGIWDLAKDKRKQKACSESFADGANGRRTVNREPMDSQRPTFSKWLFVRQWIRIDCEN
jgi:hypothetical protein